MEQRPVGRSGLVVSRLGLGTATWGRDTDPDDAAAQLVAFREAGGTLLDIGPWYVCEQTEPLIGRLLQDVVPRDELVLAVKSGGPIGAGPRPPAALSRGGLLTALDNSLLRLGVDSVDLWQLHGWDERVPMEEVLSAVRRRGLQRPGPVRRGVQPARLADRRRRPPGSGPGPGRAPLAATQVEYSLLERGVEREVLPACAWAGLGVLAYSPLGRGVLTGKYRHGVPSDSRAASPHLREFVGAPPHRRGRPDRRGGGDRGRGPRHLAAGGRAGLGPGPARGRLLRSSAPVRSASWPARWPPTRPCCRPRSGTPWTTSPRRRPAIPSVTGGPATGDGSGPPGSAPDPGGSGRRAAARRSPVVRGLLRRRALARARAGARRPSCPRPGSPRPDDVTADGWPSCPRSARSAPSRLFSAWLGAAPRVRGGRAGGRAPGCAARLAARRRRRVRRRRRPPAARRPVAAAGAARRRGSVEADRVAVAALPGVPAGRPAPRPGAGRARAEPGRPGRAHRAAGRRWCWPRCGAEGVADPPARGGRRDRGRRPVHEPPSRAGRLSVLRAGPVRHGRGARSPRRSPG